jgi:hypothetical protein
MSKTLEDRLLAAKGELAKVEAVLLKHHGTTRIPADVVTQFNELAAFKADVDAWCGMVAARRAARSLLTDLERQVDDDDTVLLGTSRAKYEHVRLIGVQAYLSTQWALADRLVGMVGRIVCTATAGLNAAQPAQLVSSFVNADRKKAPAASFYQSIRETFGWPIALSYALRNHFVHDGGQLEGVNFFAGAASDAQFKISEAGWQRVEDKARSYGVTSSHHRAGATWPSAPRDDLRAILDACERETDDALGVLVGSACQALAIHVGYMHGEL